MGLPCMLQGMHGCQEVAYLHKTSSMMNIVASAECFLPALHVFVFNCEQQAKTASCITFCSEKTKEITRNYGFYVITRYVADATLYGTVMHVQKRADG
jgi:hypothetical protein